MHAKLTKVHTAQAAAPHPRSWASCRNQFEWSCKPPAAGPLPRAKAQAAQSAAAALVLPGRSSAVKRTLPKRRRRRLGGCSVLQSKVQASSAAAQPSPDLLFEHPSGVQVYVFGVEHLEREPHVGKNSPTIQLDSERRLSRQQRVSCQQVELIWRPHSLRPFPVQPWAPQNHSFSPWAKPPFCLQICITLAWCFQESGSSPIGLQQW